MDSMAKTASRTDSQPEWDHFSATRSSSLNSYPDYAPPTYEDATASGPQDGSKSEVLEVFGEEWPETGPSPIDQVVEPVTSRDPLDPLPHCFDRAPTSNTPPEPLLQPFILQAKPGSKFLDDAFEIIVTSALERYDVHGNDWAQMLQDIQTTAQLTKSQKLTARMLPVTMYMGCTGFFVSRAIEKSMRKRNAASVVGLLDLWNERFFRPRGLEVAFCRGDWRVSRSYDCGEVQLPAPDRPNAQPRRKGCCGMEKLDLQVEEVLNGLSRCERRRVMHAGEQVTQRRHGFGCSSKKEGYRLVVTSV